MIILNKVVTLLRLNLAMARVRNNAGWSGDTLAGKYSFSPQGGKEKKMKAVYKRVTSPITAMSLTVKNGQGEAVFYSSIGEDEFSFFHQAVMPEWESRILFFFHPSEPEEYTGVYGTSNCPRGLSDEMSWETEGEVAESDLPKIREAAKLFDRRNLLPLARLIWAEDPVFAGVVFGHLPEIREMVKKTKDEEVVLRRIEHCFSTDTSEYPWIFSVAFSSRYSERVRETAARVARCIAINKVWPAYGRLDEFPENMSQFHWDIVSGIFLDEGYRKSLAERARKVFESEYPQDWGYSSRKFPSHEEYWRQLLAARMAALIRAASS